VLERLHAEFLLEHQPELVALGGSLLYSPAAVAAASVITIVRLSVCAAGKRAIVMLPDLCLESLKNGLFGEAEAEAVHESIQAFRQPSVRAMVLRSCSCWCVIEAQAWT
jgi:hypothetical protein